MPTDAELVELKARRAELRDRYAKPTADRPRSNGRGIHHAALICSDVEQTIQFYQGLLGFPLVELTENRDYPGSSHFFFDVGNQTLLGFFDFPGLGLEPGVESIGAVQHIAISVPRDRWESCAHASTKPASSTSVPTAGSRSRCTSATPTASASSCSATR